MHHVLNEGWTVGDHLGAEQLYELRKIGWRYTAMHFERGAAAPFPAPIERPGVQLEPDAPAEPGPADWDQVDNILDLIPSHVLTLLKGA